MITIITYYLQVRQNFYRVEYRSNYGYSLNIRFFLSIYNFKSQKERLMWDGTKSIWVGDTINDYISSYMENCLKIEISYFNNGKEKSKIFYEWEDFKKKYYYKQETTKIGSVAYYTLTIVVYFLNTVL